MSAAAPVLSRLKRACRAAIAASGGIDGAAASAGKARSTVGNWNNRNMADLPTLADAFVLDEVALCQGMAPPILSAMAAELGCALIRLPDCAGDGDDLVAALVSSTAEFGDVAQRMLAIDADGVRTPRELAQLVQDIDEAQGALAHMRALACRASEGRGDDRGVCA